MRNLVGAALVVGIPAVCAAQDARDSLEDQGLGVRVGAFRINPAITVGETYRTNLFLTDDDPTDTFLTTITPELSVASDWNRHAVRLDLGLEKGFYTADSSDNYLDATARLGGVLDITRDARIQARIGYLREHEERGEVDVPFAATEPVINNNYTADVIGTYESGRFRFSPFYIFEYRDFEDVPLFGGGISNQDDRDRVQQEGGLEVGYKVLRGYEAFVRGSYFMTDYEDAVDDTGLKRDWDGFQIIGGVKLDLTRLVTGSVGVGYARENYDDPALSDQGRFAFDIGIDWSATQLTTVMFRAKRSTDETTLPNASGITDSAAGVEVRHELLRNLMLIGGFDFVNREYQDISRTDNIYAASIAADWQVTRHLSFGPTYVFETRASDAPGQDYNDHQIGIFGTWRF